MKIILSGATGFVGTNLVKFFNNIPNINIIGLSRSELNNDMETVLSGSDVFIHLAGKAHDLKKISNGSEYYEVNFEMTKEIYNKYLKSNAKIFIFMSSVKAAADSIDGILTEEVDPDPQTHYGKSKLMAEQYILNQSLPAGKTFFILRPCMIHGPGNKGNLNLLYQVVRQGIPYPLAAFNNMRSFLSIDNLCFIINELIQRNDIPSGIYNLADDEPLSTNEVVSVLSRSLNKSPKLWAISVSFIKFLAIIGDKLHLPLTTERLHKLTENYIVSNLKIKTVIKKNLPLSSKAGLELTAKSFEIH